MVSREKIKNIFIERVAANRHILVVDDKQEILDLLSLMPGRHVFNVFAQSRAGDFAHEVRIMPPYLILWTNLGWADGCVLCALVKTYNNLEHTPVIMFSACHKLKEDCLFAGANAFLPKPFQMAELLQAINVFMAPGLLRMT